MADEPVTNVPYIGEKTAKTLRKKGYFCSICEKEVRNANGLVYFESDKAVQSLKVCHDCLPEGFE